MSVIAKPTSTTITAKLASGRSEKQHDCGDGLGHPLSAHDELGACHADGCTCPGYAAEKAAERDTSDDAPGDSRDQVDDTE